MNLIISPISLVGFGTKNKKKNVSIKKDKVDSATFVKQSASTKIVLGQLPSANIQKQKDSKAPVYTYPQVAWNFSNKPKQKLLSETIKKYDLKIKPKTLEYVFDINSLSDKKFQEYEAIGFSAYNLYLKTLLFKHYPYKTEGDFTQIQNAAVKSQEAAILANLFDGGLFTNVGLKAQKCHSRYFHAFLGAIIKEGGKLGHKNFIEFMKKHAQKIIIETMPKIQNNDTEEFFENFKKAGFNPKDLYIEIKDYQDEFKTKIYYQNKLITTPMYAESEQDSIDRAYRRINKLVIGGDIFANEIKDFPPPKDYRKAGGHRYEMLLEFCNDWNVEFSDINILNRAFLDRRLKNNVVLRQDNLQNLEYVGDAVLNYCVNRMLFEEYPQASKGEIAMKYHALTKNNTLGLLSRKMNLRAYLSHTKEIKDKKFDADLFEAFIGALYIDAGQNGFDKAYDFLYDNFSNIICPVEYDD